MASRQYKLLNLADLARALGTPYSALHKLCIDSKLIPSAVAGRNRLFDQVRLKEIAATVAANRTRNVKRPPAETILN